MNNKLSDEQVEQLLKGLLQARALDATALDEIADSPKLWWQIRNQISMEKAKTRRFSFFGIQRQTFAFGALAALIGFGIFCWMTLNHGNQEIARQEAVVQDLPITQNPAVENLSATDTSGIHVPVQPEKAMSVHHSFIQSVGKIAPASAQIKPAAKRSEKSTQRMPTLTAFATNIKSPRQPVKIKSDIKEDEKKDIKKEIKSDFIALSYSPAPESGQIVKVKVPRSMMVSLGVTTDVENGSELVNAEVVVGDDGLAHSIRFVR